MELGWAPLSAELAQNWNYGRRVGLPAEQSQPPRTQPWAQPAPAVLPSSWVGVWHSAACPAAPCSSGSLEEGTCLASPSP